MFQNLKCSREKREDLVSAQAWVPERPQAATSIPLESAVPIETRFGDMRYPFLSLLHSNPRP